MTIVTPQQIERRLDRRFRVSPRPEAVATPPSSITVLPAELDLKVYLGDTLAIKFIFTDANSQPVNMSGTWTAQIRSNPGDPDPPIASFTIDSTNAATGIIIVTLSATDSALLPPNIPLHWDLQQTVTSAIRTTHKGTITATADVTRP